MKLKLKKIDEQVVVITGASSGIGLVTAKRAAEAGARVVLAARNEDELAGAVEEIRNAGGRAVYAVADVADPQQVDGIADVAIATFGGIDTWVNNAGVALYGRLMDLRLEDMHRQMDVLYWGQVHGSRTAVRHLRREGGALINVASAVADRAIPLQGNYCAAKHAVKAFTDALRMELEEEGAPISVTLVKPTSIDTPLFDKAKTEMDEEPQPFPPVYAPEVVARAILECAQRPVRDVIPGGMGRMLGVANALAPRLTDRYMERSAFKKQKAGRPADGRRDNLFEPTASDGGERGEAWRGRTKETSLYTRASLHPAAALATLGLGAAAVIAGAVMLRGEGRSGAGPLAGERPERHNAAHARNP